MNFFVKSHGLGNEYIVFDTDHIDFSLTEKAIGILCDVNYGIGSDGVLLKVGSHTADFGLRIFNPDGSEAEKSGNGLRIFCKFLYDYGFTDCDTFTVKTKGGIVRAAIIESSVGKAKMIAVDMGKAIFEAQEIPADFPADEVMDERITVSGKEYEINCVSVGNPHCVIIKDQLDIDEIKTYGNGIEHHTMFPNRINVQFAKVLSRKEAEILIWERGAGFTLASGSSSCAVASVLRKKGLVNDEVTIKMLGGELHIQIDDQWNIRMTGPARQIAEGVLSDELIENFSRQ